MEREVFVELEGEVWDVKLGEQEYRKGTTVLAWLIVAGAPEEGVHTSVEH